MIKGKLLHVYWSRNLTMSFLKNCFPFRFKISLAKKRLAFSKIILWVNKQVYTVKRFQAGCKSRHNLNFPFQHNRLKSAIDEIYRTAYSHTIRCLFREWTLSIPTGTISVILGEYPLKQTFCSVAYSAAISYQFMVVSRDLSSHPPGFVAHH